MEPWVTTFPEPSRECFEWRNTGPVVMRFFEDGEGRIHDWTVKRTPRARLIPSAPRILYQRARFNGAEWLGGTRGRHATPPSVCSRGRVRPWPGGAGGPGSRRPGAYLSADGTQGGRAVGPGYGRPGNGPPRPGPPHLPRRLLPVALHGPGKGGGGDRPRGLAGSPGRGRGRDRPGHVQCLRHRRV